jgi:UDP-N-acetylmuramoyl-tripeptide--D-alanyl-D-alanine ligase
LPEVITEGLSRFEPGEHRSRVLRCGSIRLLDDCYNANPVSVRSAAAALVALPEAGRKLAVLGMMAELGPESEDLHHRTGERLADLGLDLLLAVGEVARPLADGFSAGGGRAHRFPDREEAITWLLENLRPGDCVLVKGSRSAGMEKVVARLVETLRSATE